jgi:hypothetical protein
MENLSHYQERVLDKLLPPLKKTIPYDELVRIGELYYKIFKDETDEFLLNHFKLSIESNLSFVINQDYKYQELSEYKEEHLLRVEDYIRDHIDNSNWDGIDGIKELTKDYLDKCISEQNTIIEKTIKHMVPIPYRDSLNVMQFVSDEFLDKYKYSSKRKINFLNEELNQLKGILKPIEAFEEKLGFKKEKNTKHITIRNKRILPLLTQLNLKVEFLREDCSPEDFIAVLKVASKKEIHLNIDNRNFHYLLTKIKEYFFNFTITAVGKTNKIHSKRGTLLKENNLINAKCDYPSLKDSIDKVFSNFK